MNWGIFTLYLVVCIGRSSQQTLRSILKEADVTECCPCPKSPSLDRTTGDRVLDFVSKTGKFVGDVLADDSDGSSSFLSPNEARPSLSAPDMKEDSKPFLHPEIDLASSVLNTLRDATEDEYRDALQRDAARNAASSRNSLDTDKNIEEDSLPRNIVRIDFDAHDMNDMSDIDAEESNVQETKSDPPQPNEEVESLNQNADHKAGILSKIIDPIKENLEKATIALNRDSSIVHDNIKGHLDKLLKPELATQKPSSKIQHLRLSKLFHPLNQDKSPQTKSNIEENDEIVDMNNESKNTNCNLQDSDNAASTVMESIIAVDPVNTEKIVKLAYKPSVYSQLSPITLRESSKDTLSRLKDSNQRISNILKNALKNNFNNKQDEVIKNNNSLQQVEQQSIEENDLQKKIIDMALEATDNENNVNNIACPTQQDDINEQEMKAQDDNDNIESTDSLINENVNEDFSVMTTESLIEPNISIEPSTIDPEITSNPSSEQLFSNIDGDDESSIEGILDVDQDSEFNVDSQSTDVTPMELEPFNTKDTLFDNEVNTALDSIAEGNHVTNHVVRFDGDELPNIESDSTTESNTNLIQDLDLNNVHEITNTNFQGETSNDVDKHLQKVSDKLLQEGLKNVRNEKGIDSCLVDTSDKKQVIQDNVHTKEISNVEISSTTDFNKQNKDVITTSIKENPSKKDETPSNVEQLDMISEASELSSKYALPLFSKSFEGFKSRTPQSISSIVQPEPLFKSFPSFKNNANLNSLTQQLNLPSLDDMRARLSDILNINDDGASTLFPNLNSPQMKTASSFPAVKLDLPSLSVIHNNMFPNSKLQPSNGLNLNVFKLQPSPFNGLNFNSIRTKLPLKASGPLQPLKLFSTVKDRGGVLGASIALNNVNQRNSQISKNSIETKKDLKPHYGLENFMKRKVSTINTPTHVKINKDNILRNKNPVNGFSGYTPPNVPSETKRIFTTYQKSSQDLQQTPLKSQKQQPNSRTTQRQTFLEPTSIKSNTNLKDAVIQALTNANSKDLSNNDRQNQISKPTKSNFKSNSMKTETSNNGVKVTSNIRNKSTNLLKNNNDKISYDSSPLASSPLIKNIQMEKETPLKSISENSASKKLKQSNRNIMSDKKQISALESKPFSKNSNNNINRPVLRKTLVNRKEATIPTISKLHVPDFKQVGHPWAFLKKDLLKNNVQNPPENKLSSRLWNGSKIPKIKIPLLKNSMITNHKPFEKISTVEIINPFSKDLFGSADTQTPTIVPVSTSSNLLNSKGQKQQKKPLLRAVNDDCEESSNTNNLEEADDQKSFKKGLLLKPTSSPLLNKVKDAIKVSPNERKENTFTNDPLEIASSNTETLADKPKTLSPLLEKLSRSGKKPFDKFILRNNEDLPPSASEALPSTLCMLGQTAEDDMNYTCKLICSKE